MANEFIDRSGVHACGLIFSRLGLMFREQPIGDFGIDGIIETKRDDYLSGKLIAVQIKSGDSYFKSTNNNCVVYRGELKHYNYWLNHSLPVIIVLYSPSKDICIWQHISKETAILTEKGWKIDIPLDQTLETSKMALDYIANSQTEFQHRWTSLLIAKEWMLEAEKHENLILEVEEWVNKSSGKGTFRLKVEDEAGNEKILFDKGLLGFGTRDYGLVIQDLFPWATIEIDEYFYEMNMDDECTERLNKMRYGGEYPKVYPYSNGAGEVDFYRMKLSVNSIGKSFLEIENFLEKGQFYCIDHLTN